MGPVPMPAAFHCPWVLTPCLQLFTAHGSCPHACSSSLPMGPVAMLAALHCPWVLSSCSSSNSSSLPMGPVPMLAAPYCPWVLRSEEHTSELQSRQYLVCR